MTKFTIWFLVGVAVYLVGLGIFCLIKFIRNKQKYKKELKQHEEEVFPEVSNDKESNS